MKKPLFSLFIIASLLPGCVTVDQGGLVHELEVVPQNVVFDKDNPENNTFTVTSNAEWQIVYDRMQVELDRSRGDAGETVVTVTVLKAGSSTIKVTTMKASPSDTPASKEVTVIADGGEDPDPDPDPDPDVPVVYPWAEMPKTKINGTYEYVENGGKQGNYKYVTHHAKTYSSKKHVRNYSACYDTERHNPMWVAYPCHTIYWEGGYSRPVKDPWRPDPEFERDEQSIIYSVSEWSDWPWSSTNGKPSDPYWYWSPLPSGKTVTKGHLMRSAERGNGSDRYTLTTLNEQTFYPTNISPEYLPYVVTGTDNYGYDIKQSHWALIEDILPNKWRCDDTLFVVTGCHYENEDTKLNDACNWGNTSRYSKECVVPTAKYKLIMRTKRGNTGKNIAECSANEVMAIGFWFEQNLDNEYFSALPALRTVTYSVSEIEEKIGGEFEFFPTAPEGVKDSYKVEDWPGLSAIIDKTYQNIE